jgi:hypothetical protein
MIDMNLTTNENLEQIANAIVNLDKESLMALITDDCEIQDVYFNSIEVKREEFVDWIFNRYSEYASIEPVNYSIIICNHCEIGARVILFNNGRFPYLSWMSKSVSYAGYKVENHNGYFKLSFCFSYAGCNQESFFERNRTELLNADRNRKNPLDIAKQLFKQQTGQTYERPEHPDFIAKQKRMNKGK